MKAYIIDRERVFEKLSLLKDYKAKNKVVTAGLRKASRILVVAGKQSLLQSNKKKTGNLYKSVSYIIKRMKSGAIVGFKQGGNHAHLIDLGTKTRQTKKGYNRGFYKGSGFWTNAVNNKQQQVYNTLYESIEDSILKLINRK